MEILQTEGIIFNVLNYQDYDLILNVYTKKEGLMKLIVKRGASQKTKKGVVLSPLARAEFVYTKGKSSILKCREISMLNHHLKLRQNLDWIKLAFNMIHAIRISQTELNPAPDLYKLFLNYLEKIPSIHNFYTMESSFYLKTLRHEGLLGDYSFCHICKEALKNCYVFQGESYCSQHAPAQALAFAEEEAHILHQLAFCPTFARLNEISINQEFNSKVGILFHSLVQEHVPQGK